MSAERQRENVRAAAVALAPVARTCDLVVTHGNGPQVGLLALQTMSGKREEAYPLDILDAETEGMIGYLVEQELGSRLPAEGRCATLLTQIEVDPADPAFDAPSKFIGPVYDAEESQRLARSRGWRMARDGEHYRRVVPSPRPLRIVELHVIEMLLAQDVVVICAGGGGIPVVRRADGSLIGVEAVIDKDLASALLASEVHADALLLLTDVPAVYRDFGAPGARAIRAITPAALSAMSFAPGSMGPKVEAACEFARRPGRVAAIGRLEEVGALLAGDAGTRVSLACDGVAWWD